MGDSVSGGVSLSNVPDTSSFSAYTAEAMQWAAGTGLIQGNEGKIKPIDNAARAEMACSSY